MSKDKRPQDKKMEEKKAEKGQDKAKKN